MYMALFIQPKRTNCNKSVDILHGLRQLANDKSVAETTTDLLQLDFQNFLSSGLLAVFSTSCNKSANDKLQQA